MNGFPKHKKKFFEDNFFSIKYFFDYALYYNIKKSFFRMHTCQSSLKTFSVYYLKVLSCDLIN